MARLRVFLHSRLVLSGLLALTLLAGYLVFRYFYEVAGDFPFSQEMLLVFIGAIATVLITALLLIQQTDLELRKEGQVLLLDRKAQIYNALIDHIGEIVEKGRLDPAALADLRVLNHKLAMVASAEVIDRFSDVLARLDTAGHDVLVDEAERREIMRAVAVLTYWMRRDLLGRIDTEDEEAVLAAIKANNADLE
jgi:4-amino-4-deoxy-L-arabinose transferase-like glycosyltransferase